MNSMFQRYAAAVIGFGFVAVSLSLGVGSAVACLLSAGVCYAAVALAQRKRDQSQCGRSLPETVGWLPAADERASSPRERTEGNNPSGLTMD